MKGKITATLAALVLSAALLLPGCAMKQPMAGNWYKKVPAEKHVDHGPFEGDCFFDNNQKAFFCQYSGSGKEKY